MTNVDPLTYLARIILGAMIGLLLFKSCAYAAGCYPLTIQEGPYLKQCIVCTDAYGNITSVRCF